MIWFYRKLNKVYICTNVVCVWIEKICPVNKDVLVSVHLPSHAVSWAGG